MVLLSPEVCHSRKFQVSDCQQPGYTTLAPAAILHRGHCYQSTQWAGLQITNPQHLSNCPHNTLIPNTCFSHVHKCIHVNIHCLSVCVHACPCRNVHALIYAHKTIRVHPQVHISNCIIAYTTPSYFPRPNYLTNFLSSTVSISYSPCGQFPIHSAVFSN